MTTLTRSEQVLDEYTHAPQLLLIFPASRQTWHLRLTPGFASRLASEARPYARLARSRARRYRVTRPTRRRALIYR
jgi:hypothetical protein